MSTPSETELRAELDAIKAELAALRKLLGVSATGSFTKETQLSPRFANLEIGPPGPRPIIILGESDTGGSLVFFDKEGKILTFLASTDEGGILELCTTNYKYAVVAKAHKDKGLFEVYGPAGTRSVSMTGNDNGGSVAVFAGPDSLRCLLSGAEGPGELIIWNENNCQAARLGTLNGGPMLTLIEPASGIPVANFGYVPNTSDSKDTVIGATLMLNDHTGKRSIDLASFNTGGNLRIFDSTSATAIELDSTKVGPSLSFKNPAGTSLFTINASHDGASIALNDDAATTRILLTTLNHDASILFATAEGGPGISISAKDPDNHGITVFTPGQTHGVSLITTPAGGQIAVFNADDSQFIGISHDEKIGGSLYCMDAETKQSRLTLCSGGDANPAGLFFMSPEYTPLANLVAAPTGGQLHLYTELGIVRATIRVVEDNTSLVLGTAGKGSICLVATAASTGLITIDVDGDITNQWPVDDDEE